MYYWEKGVCQPQDHDFPCTKNRHFNFTWFAEYGCWLEYSIAKDAAFCLCCYLFKQDVGDQAGGDFFVNTGYKNWKKKNGFNTHVGGRDSSHNKALARCLNLVNQKQHIESVFVKHSTQAQLDYRILLEATIDTTRFLLKQGLDFRGHDESVSSNNRGNFLELLQWLANHNEGIDAVVLSNAPGNDRLTSPDIQKDVISACAIEVLKEITSDIGDNFFSILVDECRDESIKEQMAIVLRYVNNKGNVIECLLGVEHVTSTTSLSLKEGIDSIFSRHELSISSLRGQGYEGANNMQGEFRGVKKLILKENKCAYFVHCFAHQLQLTLEAVAKSHPDITWFFNSVATIFNVAGASCKRRDALREKKAPEVAEALNAGELITGRGLNQESGLARACDTRWGSHYRTLGSLIHMYSAIIEVLEGIRDNGYDSKQVGEARGLFFLMDQFGFIFNLFLMKNVLAITNELSQALQRKEQDIVNAVNLIQVSKMRMQMMRESGWDSLLEEITIFCDKHDLDVPDMDNQYLVVGRSKRGARKVTNLHYYRVEIFYTVLDIQIQELNHRFNESSSELLICMSCFNPNNLFFAYDKDKLIRLASLYPNDFSELQCAVFIGDQLDAYIFDVRSSDEFKEIRGLGSLSQKMVETKRNIVYPLVNRLIKLALVLPVTASVERAFSAMKIIKNPLRNRMGDKFLNESLVLYVEKERFKDITNESIMQCFQKMKMRRGQL